MNHQPSFLLVLSVLLVFTFLVDGFRMNVHVGRKSSFLSMKKEKKYNHCLAILALPLSTPDRIANEAILEQSILYTDSCGKLSVILRCRDDDAPSGHSLASLRRYMSELYSAAWDIMNLNSSPLNIIVYPHQLPNTPPESWLYHRPDLECIVSHDFVVGWHSIGRGEHVKREGEGGLVSHVSAINNDRISRSLGPVEAVPVFPWPSGATSTSPNVYFLEDEVVHNNKDDEMVFLEDENIFLEDASKTQLLFGGGPMIQDELLYDYVAVGGTFDGMHYGHRKLLTLALSSVEPFSGKLLVGVTSDEMLQNKKLSNFIPPVKERIKDLREFIENLAPGMKNRVKIVIIDNPYGPPAYDSDIDALVLSHETLENGIKLNEIRLKKGLTALKLLCTRRTEGNVMSSTTLRQWRKQNQ